MANSLKVSKFYDYLHCSSSFLPSSLLLLSFLPSLLPPTPLRQRLLCLRLATIYIADKNSEFLFLQLPPPESSQEHSEKQMYTDTPSLRGTGGWTPGSVHAHLCSATELHPKDSWFIQMPRIFLLEHPSPKLLIFVQDSLSPGLIFLLPDLVTHMNSFYGVIIVRCQ